MVELAVLVVEPLVVGILVVVQLVELVVGILVVEPLAVDMPVVEPFVDPSAAFQQLVLETSYLVAESTFVERSLCYCRHFCLA